METKIISIIIYLILSILGSILFLKDIYKTHKELTLGDIVTSLVVTPVGPIILLCFLTEYLNRFKILKNN